MEGWVGGCVLVGPAAGAACGERAARVRVRA